VSENVLKLPNAIVAGDPNPAVVERIRELLDQAERGDIIAFGFAAVMSNGCFQTGWDWRGEEEGRLCMAIARLQYRFVTSRDN
jgi:hypothetical protein